MGCLFFCMKNGFLFLVRVVPCVQSFHNFVGDVESGVGIQQVVESGIADNQTVSFVLIIYLQE